MSILKQLFEQIDVTNYNNWTFPNEETMRADFSEYKKKEERKWKSRASHLGMRYPIFEDYDSYVDALRHGEVVNVTDSFANKIQHLSHTTNISELKDLVNTYVRPRDVDRIVNGFQNNDKIPYPVILKGNKGLFKMSGNTRTNVARILGITPKSLIVDVRELN